MKKAFIFDLDGTLLDSMSVWSSIGYEYLAVKGVKGIPEGLKETLKTKSLMQAASYFGDIFNIKQSPESICHEINKMMEHKYLYDIQAKDGVEEFLKKHQDNKSCIATATDRYLAQGALTRLGLNEYFDFIITSTEVGNSKQSPDIFIKSAHLLNADIKECVVFEDALHAVKAAKSAGFYTVGVYEKHFEGDAEQVKKIADQYVCKLSEVII